MNKTTAHIIIGVFDCAALYACFYVFSEWNRIETLIQNSANGIELQNRIGLFGYIRVSQRLKPLIALPHSKYHYFLLFINYLKFDQRKRTVSVWIRWEYFVPLRYSKTRGKGVDKVRKLILPTPLPHLLTPYPHYAVSGDCRIQVPAAQLQLFLK